MNDTDKKYKYYINILKEDENKRNVYLQSIINNNVWKVAEIESILSDDDLFSLYSDLKYGYTPYLLAIKHGSLDVVKHFDYKFKEKYKSDIKSAEKYLMSPFHKATYGHDAYLCAAEHGFPEIMEHLENTYQWNINVKNNRGNNAFIRAAYFGKLNVIKYLLDIYPNYDYLGKNACQECAYYHACAEDNVEIIEYFDKFMHFSNPNNNIYNHNFYNPKNRQNPYHVCAKYGSVKVAKFLLEKNYSNMDIEALTKDKYNVVEIAIVNNKLKFVEFMVTKAKWDWKKKSAMYNKTPLEFAKMINRNNIVTYLETINIDLPIFRPKTDLNCIICHADIENEEEYVQCGNSHPIHKECYVELKIYKNNNESDDEFDLDDKCQYCKSDYIKCLFVMVKHSSKGKILDSSESNNKSEKTA